jgi:hypothetical protein
MTWRVPPFDAAALRDAKELVTVEREDTDVIVLMGDRAPDTYADDGRAPRGDRS